MANPMIQRYPSNHSFYDILTIAKPILDRPFITLIKAILQNFQSSLLFYQSGSALIVLLKTISNQNPYLFIPFKRFFYLISLYDEKSKNYFCLTGSFKRLACSMQFKCSVSYPSYS